NRLPLIPLPARAVEIGAVDDDSHGTIVVDLDVHVGAEATAADANPEALEMLGEGFDRRRGCFRVGGAVEARTAAAADVGDEGELADHQRFAAHVLKGKIEAALAVVEDAHFRRL